MWWQRAKQNFFSKKFEKVTTNENIKKIFAHFYRKKYE